MGFSYIQRRYYVHFFINSLSVQPLQSGTRQGTRQGDLALQRVDEITITNGAKGLRERSKHSDLGFVLAQDLPYLDHDEGL